MLACDPQLSSGQRYREIEATSIIDAPRELLTMTIARLSGGLGIEISSLSISLARHLPSLSAMAMSSVPNQETVPMRSSSLLAALFSFLCLKRAKNTILTTERS